MIFRYDFQTKKKTGGGAIFKYFNFYFKRPSIHSVERTCLFLKSQFISFLIKNNFYVKIFHWSKLLDICYIISSYPAINKLTLSVT